MLILLLLPLCFGAAASEWVDVPQFSDRHKVYGAPMSMRPHQSELYQRKLYQIRPDQHRGDYQHYHDKEDHHHQLDFRITTEPNVNLRNLSTSHESHPKRFSSFEEDIQATYAGTIATYTTERVISTIVELDELSLDETSEQVLDKESMRPESPTPQYSSEIFVTQLDESKDPGTTEIPRIPGKKSQQHGQQQHQPVNKTEDKGFLDYLPVDLLKRVHKTLKSQPPTLKGKIRFLKAFERALVNEIEERLSAALAPARVPRGARDHYDHYEHDDSIGFPSLEGTLMAISFLTFAVYLVRLVMLLFRNANNNVPPIFIGRKKRSIDDFHEEAARILGYLESSLPSQYVK